MPSKSRPLHRKPELMAPAGDWASLRAALKAGADAVYFGLRGLNMRSNYRNFTPAEMQRIAAECHRTGARAYLALNTIIYDTELSKVDRILKIAAQAGIDAVICWDMAVVQKAKALGLPVFLSTQMSVSNSASLALFYRTFGIRRFVLARSHPVHPATAQKRTRRRGREYRTRSLRPRRDVRLHQRTLFSLRRPIRQIRQPGRMSPAVPP